MPQGKYLSIDNTTGQITELAAIQTSAGAGDAGKIPALNSSGQIDATMLPTSGDVSVAASEDLSAGDFINLFNSAGSLKMRKADNTSSSKKAHGFVSSAVTTGSTGTATLGMGVNPSVSGLTIGTQYFLGTVGGVSTSPPTASGSIVQALGVAKSATELGFVEKDIVVRA
jgi:hypothetical protein